MATWNMFSQEVANKRQSIRDYDGYSKYVNRVPQADSYKSQALLELAARLEIENQLNASICKHSELIDKIEALETELGILKMERT